MKKKAFDCVDMQHRGGEEVRRKTAGMTLKEEVCFWHEQAEALRKLQEETHRKTEHAAACR